MGMRGIRSPPQEGEGGLEPRETVEQSAVSMQSSSAITSKTPIVQRARLLEVCVTQSSSCDAQNEGCLQPRSRWVPAFTSASADCVSRQLL